MLEEWLLAIFVLALSFALTALTQRLLKKLHLSKDWRVIGELAPSFCSLLYAVGLKLFLEIAPITGRLEVWLNAGIYILSVVFVLILTFRAAMLSLDWSVNRTGKANTLQQGFVPLVRNVITLFVFFMGGIMVLKHFNYDVMSLITALGVGSLAVGLAAKDTFSNMISGFILIIDQNLSPGDRINLGGNIGDVKEIGLRSTQILLPDGNTLIVPNSDLVNTKILNLSLPNPQITCTVQVRIPFSVTFARVKALCQVSAKNSEKINPSKPLSVSLLSLADGHQLIQIVFWIREFSSANASISDFNERLLENLRQEGITPVPPPGLNSSN